MMIFDEDDEDSQENKSEIKELTFEEVRCLEKLVKVLKNNKDTDSIEKHAEEAINKVPKKHPFELKYEQNIPKTEDWQSCTFVLDKGEKLKELLKGW